MIDTARRRRTRAKARAAAPANVAAPPAPARTARIEFVDGLRALAALVVVFNHVYGAIWLDKSGLVDSAYRPLSFLLVWGHLAVSVFIVISGFVLTLGVVHRKGALNGGIARFLRRRARRILPPYYAALALSLLLIATAIPANSGWHWDNAATYRPSDLAAHLLLVQDIFGTGRINYVFWSIAVEWQIYLVFPLILLFWRRLGGVATIVLALVAGYALIAAFGDTRLGRAYPYYLGLFTLGMGAAWIALSDGVRASRLRTTVPWGLIAVASFASVVGLSALWGLAAQDYWALLDLLVGVFAAALLIAGARPGRNRLRDALAWRPLVFVGGFSYSLYLVHAPLLEVLRRYALVHVPGGELVQFAVLGTIGVAVILAISYAFFALFERPLLGGASKRPTGRDATAEAPAASTTAAAPSRVTT